VLVDTCETAEEIDVRRAEEAKERAEEQLRQRQSVGEYKMSQSALARALSRLEFSSQKKHYI
jgi:F-type H+-transporting ATPase subunit epsilon